jgi:hypothetical protein
MRKVKLFVCYEREDDEHWFAPDSSRPWLGSKGFIPWLQENLHASVEGIWWDKEGIRISEQWEKRIHFEIDKADVAVLLIGQGFLNSKFIIGQELPHIRRRAEEGYMQIFPIVTNPCRWEECQALDFIRERQILAVQQRPLSESLDNRAQWLQTRNQIFEALQGVVVQVQQRRQVNGRPDLPRGTSGAKPKEDTLRLTASVDAGAL